MKILAFLALFALFSACASTAPPESEAPSVTFSPVESEAPTPAPPTRTAGGEQPPSPEVTAPPEPEPTPVPEDWQKIFRQFIETKYDKILESFLSGVAGIGFIDLNLDGLPELLIFDLGASASMGVQIFDIIDGEVECVSANIAPVGEAFGGGHMSDACVTANELSSFRLLRDKATGEYLFIAQSGNGAMDFLYSAIVKFGEGEDGEVTAEKYLSRFEEYAEADGADRTVTAQSFEYMGAVVDEARYMELLEEFNTAFEDEGYEAQGAFIWENAAYEKDFEGLVAMYDGALKAYVPLGEAAS